MTESADRTPVLAQIEAQVAANRADQVTYRAYGDSTNLHLPVTNLYPWDLDNDGSDEILVASWETQPNTPAEYTNTELAVLGWRDGALTNLTDDWLPGDARKVEGVGAVGFGDFNGDGWPDAMLTAYTDMDHPVNNYMLINRGGTLEKRELSSATWQHGVDVADINGDGIDDAMIVGYDRQQILLGDANNDFDVIDVPHWRDHGWATGGASDVALGDWRGDGTVSAVLVDHGLNTLGSDAEQDTVLTMISVDQASGSAVLTDMSLLPGPIMGASSHDVSVFDMDFDRDGDLDIIVSSRAARDDTGRWPEQSTLQWLANDGAGQFTDVTQQVLPDYKTDTQAVYNPVIADFNGDGLEDIFVSQASWEMIRHDSTALLMANADGTYSDTNRDVFKFIMTRGAIATVARDDSGQWQVVRKGPEDRDPDAGISSYFMNYALNWSAPSIDEPVVTEPQAEPVVTEPEAEPVVAEPVVIAPVVVPPVTVSPPASGGGGGGGGGGNRSASTRLEELKPVTKPRLEVEARSKQDAQGNNIVDVDVSVAAADIRREGEKILIEKEFSVLEVPVADRVFFDDAALAFDAEGSPGQAYRMYRAIFGRESDAEGLGFWIDRLDADMDIVEVAARFIDSAEFRERFGTDTSDGEFLTRVYGNVLGREPDADGLDWWLTEMEVNPEKTRHKVLADFSESTENFDMTIELIAQGIMFQPWNQEVYG